MADSSQPRKSVPTPTWVPILKTSLSSWRAGPTEVANSPTEARPKELFIVRAAGVPVATVKAVVAANGVADARVAEMAPPRAIAKGSTPHAGPAAPPAIDGMSPANGLSPNPNTNDPPMPPPLEGGNGNGLPAMSLGPALEEQLMKTSALACAVVRDRRSAEDIKRKLCAASANDKTGAGPLVDIVDTPFPSTCTVVLKGVPLTIKHERLWQELSSLQSATPTYLRFHRNDRGLFKNVVYVRFPSAIEAELGRMELERFTVGGRPLKVEFKKPRAATAEETQRAEAARREDLKVATQGALEAYASELAKSTENEGFTIPKAQLNKDETRYLRGVAQAHEFTIDIGAVNITVKKRVAKSVSPSMGPARTPPFHPATPSTHAADPDAAAGMQFRGIRHWRDQRAAVGGHTHLGHMHTLGPADGIPAWSAGRGRPSKC